MNSNKIIDDDGFEVVLSRSTRRKLRYAKFDKAERVSFSAEEPRKKFTSKPQNDLFDSKNYLSGISYYRSKLEEHSGMADFLELLEKCVEDRMTKISNPKLILVCLGIGNLNSKSSKIQFSLLEIIRERLSDKISVGIMYDPIMSRQQISFVQGKMGYQWLEANHEPGKIEVSTNQVTLAFLPYCPMAVNAGIIECHLQYQSLDRLIVMGNDLNGYKIRQELSFGQKNKCLESILKAVKFIDIRRDLYHYLGDKWKDNAIDIALKFIRLQTFKLPCITNHTT